MCLDGTPLPLAAVGRGPSLPCKGEGIGRGGLCPPERRREAPVLPLELRPGMGFLIHILQLALHHMGVDLVEEMSAWPSISWMDRRSAPFSSRWTAKEWRRVWGVMSFSIPAFS